MPIEPDSIAPLPPDPATAPLPPRKWWQGRLLTICFAVFAFEVGLFLVVFPWQDSWTLNYFQGISPSVRDLWDEPSFKGLVTGLGFVNIYISLLQIARLFRH